jgi:hypothetical protein
VITAVFDLHLTNPFDANLAAPMRGTMMAKLNSHSRITHHTIEYPT